MFWLAILAIVCVCAAVGVAIWVIVKKEEDAGGINWVIGGQDSLFTTAALYTSTDANSWTENTLTGTSLTGINSIAYGPDLWVAVGITSDDANNAIIYSTDAKSWHVSTGVSNAFNNTIAYGLSSDGTGMWLTGGNNAGQGVILISEDGKDWTSSVDVSASQVDVLDIAYGLSDDNTTKRWVAVGIGHTGTANVDAIIYSDDNGGSWSNSAGVSGTDMKGVAYGLSSDGSTGIWSAVGDLTGGGGGALYSLDGKTWQSASGVSASHTPNKVAFGKSSNGTNSLWVLSANDQDGLNETLYYSNDAQNWSLAGTSGFDTAAIDVAFGDNNKWVAVGTGEVNITSSALYSSNGTSWTEITGVTNLGNGQAVASDLLNPALTW